MHANHLFEYAVIRFVPKVEREEFINIGVILLCKRTHFLEMKYEINRLKLAAFDAETLIETLENQLQAMDKICRGMPEGGAMAKEDAASRFRWLTAVRSAVIQTSRPHHGFSTELKATVNKLFDELVV